MLKFLDIILFIIIINLYSTPLEEIYKNRFHIIEFYNCIDNGNSIDTIICNDNRNNCYLYDLKDSSFSKWEQNEKDIISYFVKFVPDVSKKYKRYNFYISDSVVIKILASLLDYSFKTNNIKPYSDNPPLTGSSVRTNGNWNHDALVYLTYDTYLPCLKKHSNLILYHLNNCSVKTELKMSLKSLCTFTALEQNNILGRYDRLRPSKSDLFPWIRIRLGDTLVEKNVIDALKRYQKKSDYNQMDFSGALYFATNGILSGSDSALFYTIKLFEKNAYSNINWNGDKTQFCRSLQDSLIFLIARQHPDTPLFQNRLHMLTNPRDYCDLKSQEKYFIDFQTWIKKTYGYNISYDGFIPYFERLCDESMSEKYCK